MRDDMLGVLLERAACRAALDEILLDDPADAGCPRLMRFAGLGRTLARSAAADVIRADRTGGRAGGVKGRFSAFHERSPKLKKAAAFPELTSRAAAGASTRGSCARLRKRMQ